MHRSIEQLIKQLAAVLQEGGLTMATAESCTGGAIASACTSLAGSSAWFEGGVVSYSNPAKVKLLGVEPVTLERCGAVSAEVVEQMAAGICQRLDVDCSIATSGIAGPGGGSDAKPVGTVWIATSVDGVAEAHCYRFAGDRAAVQAAATIKSLQTLLQRLTV